MMAAPSRRWCALLPLALLLATACACAAEVDTPIQKEGRALTLQFQRGETAAIFARMTPPMRQTAGSPEDLKRFREQVLVEAGAEQAVLSEGEVAVGPYRTYRRLARHTRATRPILTEWVFDSELAVVGFIMKPEPVPAPSQYLDYQTHSRLRLPFEGAWYVFWGGRTVEQNYHAVVRDQRFAYDFVVVAAGRTHDGDGSKVDDYFCWNRPVLAPSSATVVAAIDDLPDNVPGKTDPSHPVGNHAILDLGEGEFAVLAHLKNGSLRVARGQRIERGAEIGRCGNSGNTTEPHLHFHLQDGARFGSAEGLPAFFTDYFADGKLVARGEPLRGQTVANAPDGAAQ